MAKEDSEQEEKKPEKQPHKPGKHEFLVVGIGASAGGIQAMQEFFKNVPEDSGMAYVVILHLSPDHDSQLASVLQQVTKIPVAQVTEKIHIKPNHIYVVPPNRHLTMKDSHIIVSPNTLIEDRRAPVDIFFRTLADEMGPRAVSVVLSGTGANGSMGLKRIKERGGTAFVQNPREAEFNEMPRNSIATDLVDEVLPVAEIPARIIAYKNSLGTVEIAEEAEKRPEDHQQALREIFTLIRTSTGHDFSNYKRPTLLRRLERRINVRGLPDLPAYVKYIQKNPDEASALLKDLLISVTNFFRDKKAFEIIETEILPILLKNKTGEEQLRIWIAGCATGEEAYSLAMLCAEKTMDVPGAPKIQIFATDIDEAAITHAREGYYTLNDAADVSPERLRRFFTKERDGYRIRREIRDSIMFATHNFIKDPPFSRLDLVSCRNVMIYLNRSAQERVVETFHFALNPGGYLLLGSSESIDGATDLYAVYNREQHIFQSRQVATKTYPVPQTSSGVSFNRHKNIEPFTPEHTIKTQERISFGELHQQLLEAYAPPSLVVNEEYDIVHLTEKASKYLQIGGGEISQNLLKLVKPELRMELRSALYQAMQRQSVVEARGLKVGVDDKTETINIHVRPVLRHDDMARGYILVIFETSTSEEKQEIILSTDEPFAKQLEDELTRLKMHVRSSNEQHEFQAEELKASNEELQAMNEELRSAAEELETTKEELQSMNEELRTVNQELKVKIEETSITRDNLQNLNNSTDIATVFLDRSFRVILFTPFASNIFNLIPADYGRPLSDITNKLVEPDFLKDAESVLDKLSTIEREVETLDGTVYLMRITPYRTDEDHIKGVVISFINITENRRAQETVQKSEERLQRIVNIPQVGVLTFDYSGTMLHANDAFLKIIGYEREKFNAHKFTWRDFTPPEHAAASFKVIQQLRTTGKGGPYEKEYFRRDGSRVWIRFVGADLGDGTIVEFATDITSRKIAEEALSASEERLRVTMESAVDFAIITMNTERIIEQWNTGAERIFGFTAEEAKGKSADIIFTEEDKQKGEPEKEMQTAKLKGYAEDERWHQRKDGSRFYASGIMRSICNPELSGYVKIARDMTQQKLLDQQKDDFIGIASHELRTPVTSIKAYTELLQDMCNEGDYAAGADIVKKLGDQVERLISLIHGLLDTSKISESQMTISPEQFDMNQLIAERIEEIQPSAKNHRLVRHTEGALNIVADRNRIGEVLTNLLSNAVKYSPAGEEIIINSSATNEGIQVSVADKGIGISEDAKEKIFGRFFRGNHPKINTYPGMGLGLYIAAGIIHQHAGKIWVESEPGQGSIFYFMLPYQQ